MTESEKLAIIDEVLSSLHTNSQTIDQLTPVYSLTDSDHFEVNGGRRISFTTVAQLIAAMTETELRSLITALYDKIGATDGLCPLDSGGKVSERYLPSYVDDVVEVPVISDHEVVENEQVHIYDEMPEEYKDLPTSSDTDLFMQAPPVLQCCAGKFYLIGSVYRGHSVIDYFHVRNFDGWERFGAKDSTGTVTAVSGKIYVDLSNATNDCIYRWSGVRMIKLVHSPLTLGDYSGTAYPGDSGKKNAEDISGLKIDFQQLGASLGTLNLMTYPDSGPYADLEEALSNTLGRTFYEKFAWPQYGSQVRFLAGTVDDCEWQTWRFEPPLDELMNWDNPEILDDWDNFGYLTPLAIYWRRIDNINAGGSSGDGNVTSCDCQEDCKANAQAIVKIQKSLTELTDDVATAKTDAVAAKNAAKDAQSAASSAAGSAQSAVEAANSAVEAANSANEKATTAQADVDDLKTRVATLEDSAPSAGGSTDSIQFVGLDDEGNGVLKGAHTSGLTYNMPTTKFNLLVTYPSPSITTDTLIILPTSLSLEGTVMRILDSREGMTATAPRVRIQPYDAGHYVLGHEKESDDYWIGLQGGYVELMAVNIRRATSGTRQGLQWVVTKCIKFNS